MEVSAQFTPIVWDARGDFEGPPIHLRARMDGLTLRVDDATAGALRRAGFGRLMWVNGREVGTAHGHFGERSAPYDEQIALTLVRMGPVERRLI